MLVDTGATTVSVTPVMVEALGLKESLGELVEVTLAGGIRIKAPQLFLPSMTVAGKEAKYVKALMLNPSLPGVDGCVGLSFLNRFDYVIEKALPQKLVLEQTTREEAPGFDVFISHNSEDLSCANKVYDVLEIDGFSPFLSELALEKAGQSSFQKATENALETAHHLVVVASSRQNLESPWVEAEWRLFDHLLKAGKKPGNIVPVLCGDMKVEDLPPSLRAHQATSIAETGWEDRLTSYLK